MSDEDRKTIIEIARQALARFQPTPNGEPKPGMTAGPRPEAETDGHSQPHGAEGEVMSDTTASLRRKIGSAGDLQSVVRTMKALAASSIGQYETIGARAWPTTIGPWSWG